MNPFSSQFCQQIRKISLKLTQLSIFPQIQESRRLAGIKCPSNVKNCLWAGNQTMLWFQTFCSSRNTSKCIDQLMSQRVPMFVERLQRISWYWLDWAGGWQSQRRKKVVLEQEQKSLCHPVLLPPACTGDLEQILMGRNQWLICASANVSLLADVSHAAT